MEQLVTTTLGAYLNAMALVAPQKAGEHGVSIFCYPVRPSMKHFHKAFLESSEKFSFKLGDVNLQAYQWGNGPKKILFLHGWQSHSFRWKNYVQALPGNQYTVYAFDAPGHGFSEGKFLSVPFYAEAIQQFIGKVGVFDSVVAHSMGSFSLIYALYKVPLLPVSKVVLMASPGEATDFIKVYKDRLNLTDRTINHILLEFQKRFEQPISYFSAAKFAASLRIPGVVIHDREDDEAPYKYAHQINKAWKHSHLITTSGLGHNLKSQEVVKTVLDFVTGTVGKDFTADQYKLMPEKLQD